MKRSLSAVVLTGLVTAMFAISTFADELSLFSSVAGSNPGITLAGVPCAEALGTKRKACGAKKIAHDSVGHPPIQDLGFHTEPVSNEIDISSEERNPRHTYLHKAQLQGWAFGGSPFRNSRVVRPVPSD